MNGCIPEYSRLLRNPINTTRDGVRRHWVLEEVECCMAVLVDEDTTMDFGTYIKPFIIFLNLPANNMHT